MSDPPPPTGPPAGWYPDPAGAAGYRWWNGSAWTEQISGTPGATTGPVPGPGPVAVSGSGPIGDVGPWLGESLSLSVRRAGHVLPFVVLFVVGLALPSSFALWYGLRDTVLTFDPEAPLPTVDHGGSSPALLVAALLIPISMLAAVVAKAAVARQAWAAQAGAPEEWSASLDVVRSRWRSVLSVAVGRTGLYWLLNGAFVAGVIVTPVFMLLFPFLVVVQVLVWLRLCFASQAAVLAPVEDRPFATSFEVSGRQAGRLFGRLLLAAFVAANMILAAGLIGAPFTSLAGAEAAPPLEPGAEVLVLDDHLGASVWIFALGSVFSALGLGANHVVASVATTLLYRNLGGPAEPIDREATGSEANGSDAGGAGSGWPSSGHGQGS